MASAATSKFVVVMQKVGVGIRTVPQIDPSLALILFPSLGEGALDAA
jgi:hypothetical protein